MAEPSGAATEVNARVVYWGIEGSGKSSNLRAIYSKLRPDHRSEVREVPTRFDPSASYEILPIELGEIAGVRTRLQIIAVPGAAEQAPTRKQLLDRVDGVVLILDSSPERLDENVRSFEELQQALVAYGRRLDQIPLVIQYNKRDLADPYAMEALHRKLELDAAPVFEAVAAQGTGVLETLSTISKRVIRSLRGHERAEAVAPEPAPVERPLVEPPPAPLERPLVEPPPAPLERPLVEPPPAPLERPLVEPPPAPLERPLVEPPPAPLERPQPPEPRPAQRMEQAILEEGSDPDADSAALEVETSLETPAWEQIAGEIDRPIGVRVGRDLTIVSVGPASRVGDRKVRVPLVLGDASGQTTSVALGIEIEPLIDEDP